jgi:glutamate/tyrosine decarboxylase-like PLP-dependent enzyme
VDHCLDIAAYAASRIQTHPDLELALEPALTVMLLRRRGWRADEYTAWSEEALRSGLGFITPTKHLGETVLRFCFINPLTSREDIDLLLADLG